MEILLDHPLAGALLLFALLCGGAAFLRTPETGFLPAMDEGGFVLDYTLPVGSSLDETDAACRRIEGILGEVPEVASFSRRTGAELGFFATEVFTGDFLVGLVEPGERRRSVFEVIADLRDRLAHEVPQAQIEFVQVMQDTMNDLAGNPEPIEVRLLGDDYPRLQKAAHAVAERIDKIHGIVDVAEGVSFGSPDLVWRPDPARLARLGLDTSAIAAEVSAQLLGVVATRIQEGDRFVDVRVRYPESWRRDVAGGGESGEIFVNVPDADERPALEPLSAIAQLSRSFSENELERENQVPVVRVTAAVEGRDLGSASRAVEAAVRALPETRSPVHVEFGGQAASQKSAFENMLMVFGLGTGLVFLLLVVQFRSLMLPFVIFLALPFGQVGALWALQLTGVPLNVSSGMGMVMLVGLVVKNGIIMIEYAQELAREGHPEREAVLDAARVRLRPILMTTLAAVAGLVPLALGLAPGMELQRPLAIAVIGGLLVSTSFTLLVVPLGCATLGRGRLQPEVRHDH